MIDYPDNTAKAWLWRFFCAGSMAKAMFWAIDMMQGWQE